MLVFFVISAVIWLCKYEKEPFQFFSFWVSFGLLWDAFLTYPRIIDDELRYICSAVFLRVLIYSISEV